MIKTLSTALMLSLSGTVVMANELPLIVEDKALLQPAASTELEMPDQQALSQADTAERLYIKHIQFQGGTVFELTELASLVEPLIEQQVDRQTLASVLKSITRKYQQAGYPLAYAMVPEQSMQAGQLTIVLVEGAIVRSELVVEDESVRQRIEALITRLYEEKPLHKATFERVVGLIEQIPGYSFSVHVPKPKTFNGATTIRVEQDDFQKYEWNFGWDTGSEDDTHLLAGLTINDLSRPEDSLRLSSLIPNDSVKHYYMLNYERALGNDGLKLDVSTSQFKTEGDDRIFASDVPLNYQENKTRSRISADIKYPLQLGQQSAWWIGSGLDYVDEEADYNLSHMDGSGALAIEKDLRYSALSIFTNWHQATQRHHVNVQAKIKQGLDLIGHENRLNTGADTVRGSESTHFNLLRLDAGWRYRLSPRWRVQTKANLFWSDDILPSAEQIRYGGARYGRGYVDGQAQGDRGTAIELELRYQQPVSSRFISNVQPYLILDASRTELNANERVQALSSAALGVDISYREYYRLGFELARPLGDPHVESDDRSPVYSLRLRWQL